MQTTNRVFGLLGMVMEDEDRDVRKAVAWVLREITKANSDEVTQFLVKWARANPGKEARWVIENGIKKLSPDEQNRVLRLLEAV